LVAARPVGGMTATAPQNDPAKVAFNSKAKAITAVVFDAVIGFIS